MSKLFGTISPELYEWIVLGAKYPSSSRIQILFYRYTRFLFRLNLFLQSQIVNVRPVSKNPVFILGAWRSGTTFLHELMACHSGFYTPQTWQVMSPSTFGIMGMPNASKCLMRPMDDFTIDTNSPQEDEFALLALGFPSLYRSFLDPRRIDELSSLLDLKTWERPNLAERKWLQFLEQVQESSKGIGKRLLLKSPNHSFRFPMLKRNFPAMKGVWIIRNPEEIWQSNRRLWPVMAEQYGLASIEYGKLEGFLYELIVATGNALRHWSSALSPKDLVVISLDELKSNPICVVKSIFKRLDICELDSNDLLRLHELIQLRQQIRTSGQRGLSSHKLESNSSLSVAFAALNCIQLEAYKSHGLKCDF